MADNKGLETFTRIFANEAAKKSPHSFSAVLSCTIEAIRKVFSSTASWGKEALAQSKGEGVMHPKARSAR
jgi:hypothetical protein